MSATFSVGDTVTYLGNYNGKPLKCKVIRVMPRENDLQTYHIRDEAERFDRAVPESTLTKVERTKLARTFDI